MALILCFLTGAAGFEPATCGFGDRYSKSCEADMIWVTATGLVEYNSFYNSLIYRCSL